MDSDVRDYPGSIAIIRTVSLQFELTSPYCVKYSTGTDDKNERTVKLQTLINIC